MINPDAIQDGDQVTLAINGGLPTEWTVRRRLGSSLQVEAHGDVKTVRLGGKRTTCQILGHQPRLV